MKTSLGVVCGCALALLAAAGTAQADLVVNGGFETGDFTGWTTTAAGTGSLFFVDGDPHSGNSAAAFGAVSGLDDQISQVLATTAGSTYTLSFWLDNLGSGGDHFNASWEGVTVFDESPVAFANAGYRQITINVTATTNGSELRFGSFDGPSYEVLDDVSVEVAPTPGVASLLGLGGLVATRRRRSR